MKSLKLLLLGLASFAIPLIFFFQSNELSLLKKQDAKAKADSVLRKSIGDSVKKELAYSFNLRILKDSFDIQIKNRELGLKQDVIDILKMNDPNKPISLRADINLPSSINSLGKANENIEAKTLLDSLRNREKRLRDSLRLSQEIVKSLSITVPNSQTNTPKPTHADSLIAQINQLNDLRAKVRRGKDQRFIDSLINVRLRDLYITRPKSTTR